MAAAGVDEDFQRMWDETAAEYMTITRRDLRENVSLEAENLLVNIKEDKLDDEERQKWKKSKEYLRNSLKCISTLGKIAAQGATMAFGPAQLCFNAASFLIDTTQKYEKIFSGLGDLFEKIYGFLYRFEVYARPKAIGVKIDHHLKVIIHKLLRKFVDICALSTKLASTKGKFRAALSAFAFGSDQGVSAAMTSLQFLVEEETRMTIALTLEETHELKGFAQTADTKLDNVDQNVTLTFEAIRKAEKRKDQESFIEKNQREVKDFLKIKKETWNDHQDEFLESAVENTGRWLLEDDQFTAWKATSEADDTNPVIEHLKDAFKNGNQTDRVSVAYFFFKEDRSSRNESPSVNTMNNALRSIVWQLSLNDPAYQKFVAGVRRNFNSCSSNTIQFWEKAIRDYAKTSATFIIILDGIDNAKNESGKTQLLVRILQDIASMTKDANSLLRIRLFLTGREKEFSELFNESGTTIHRVVLGQVNRDDIVQFIKDQLVEMPALHTKDDLRATICDKLLQIAGGDYLKLTPILEEIRKKHRGKEIEATLARASKDPQEALHRQIDELNAQLDAQDVEDLNELLMWVALGATYFSVKQMEMVLFLKNSASREDSLVTLADQIDERYSMLLYVDDDGDVMPTPTLSYIKDLQGEKQETEEEDVDSEDDTKKLHKSEVDIVRRFLKQVCDDKLFAKFGFEELFQRKLGKKKVKIEFQPPNGHVRILLTVLKAIHGEDRDKAKPLHEYAITWLDHHLNEVDLAHTEHKAKQEIGALLFQLFTDEKCIKTWWTDAQLDKWVRYYLDCQNDLEDAVLRWFKDSVVVEHLSENDKHWIDDLSSKSKPEEDLFKHITRVTARDWLQSFKWPFFNYFYWVYAFVTKIETRSSRMKPAPEKKELLKIPADMIYAAEKWAKKELAVDKPDVQWIVRVAYTLSHFGHQAEALERWCLARSMDPHSWMVDLLYTKIQRGQQEYESCLETSSALAERFRANESLKKEFACSWKEVLHTIADAYHYLDQHEASIRASRQLLEEFPNDYNFVMTMVERFDQRGNYHEVITLLEELDKPRPIEKQKQNEKQQNGNKNEGEVVGEQEEDNENESGSPTKLTVLYHALASSDEFDSYSEFHYRVARAARATNSMAVVREAFRKATDAAEAPSSASLTTTSVSPDEDKRFTLLTTLRYYHALTLMNHGTRLEADDVDSDAKEAVELLERNLLPNKPSPTSNTWALRFSARTLAGLYFQQAKSVGLHSPASSQWTKKLCTLVEKQSSHASSIGERLDDISLVLGRLLCLDGREKDAREAVRAYVRVALNLLDDDDPGNDWQAYMLLTRALGSLDDDENTLAAFGLIRIGDVKKGSDGEASDEDRGGGERGGKGEKTAEQQKGVEEHTERNDSENDKVVTANVQPPQATSASEGDVTGPESSTGDEKQGTHTSSEDGTDSPVAGDGDEEPMPPRLAGPMGGCHGSCNTEWVYAADIYVCKDCCLSVYFCSVCIDKLRAGTLERQICGRDHTFLHVPKWSDIAAADEAAGGVSEGYVRVGNEVLTIKDWINGIRVKWGFPKVD